MQSRSNEKDGARPSNRTHRFGNGSVRERIDHLPGSARRERKKD
jgi:hypothetical protein